MVVKTTDPADVDSWETSTLPYPVVETIHEDSICKLVYAPARNISAEVTLQAQVLARKAVASFIGRGIFGVELFLINDNRILVNEIAPRVRVSGSLCAAFVIFLASKTCLDALCAQRICLRPQRLPRSRDADAGSIGRCTTLAITRLKPAETASMIHISSQS